uniref:Nucleoside-triphosphatase THEP1 n=1 Tax=Tetraselmis sp. GSL018 TaxID=582737 RepID=A0A061SBF8_9CHLO|eukprot:CAMPEP_0177587374 /NCGR_PEP_ID=MMETSP0419_2-20121207/5611_1 /TAXON_ID=582737 /ORGANISM="Tetraselmis sp., Strain GSL018" /LENGTH=365 /DNA_ID=CAMNT_0019077407 /DNA_START=86 /DNA_END=1183 /DNA_ORIENTATION=-
MPHIFITGQPGVGKTTLVRSVVERLRDAQAPQKLYGFYTEELRGPGGRTGFDVVTIEGERGPLARIGNPKKGEPAVGKYAVDVASFERLALPQMKPTPGALVVVDEVGKMELFSKAFSSAVTELLDSPCLVLGTIPVPKYGRTIPQVETIKARPDVEVLQITKGSRDGMADKVFQDLLPLLGGRSRGVEGRRGHTAGVPVPEPCPPMFQGLPGTARVLLLGHTSSPLPSDPSMAYSERSMWKILDNLIGAQPGEPYAERTARVGQLGVALWDVVADVHLAGQRSAKRHRGAPNDIPDWLERNPGVHTIAFNGAKAAEAAKEFMPDTLQRYRTVVLPSSSSSNSRTRLSDKLTAWREALGELSHPA